jgi:hypothetical protein
MDESNTKENTNNIQDNLSAELGDRIHIVGGRFNNTSGKIYYLDNTTIKILPDGVADRLIILEMKDGYLKEEYEIENIFVISKRVNPSFVVQQDYRKGQLAEAFNGPEGDPVGKYIIEEVNEKEDNVILKDQNGDNIKLEFNFIGIPLDTGIDVLRSREAPSPTNTTNEEEEIQEDNTSSNENAIDFGDTELFEIKEVELKEINTYDRIYPDTVQRSDMLYDLITKLNNVQQKSPERIKEIRKLTELCLLLRNELVSYGINGLPDGKKNTSFDTILDLVRNTNNNFSKPVVDVKRVVYLDKTQDTDNTKETKLNIDIRYLEDEIIKENEYAKIQFSGNQNVISEDILPNWYIGWDKYNKENFISWTSKIKQNATSFTEDKDFFRAPYPEDINDENVHSLAKVPYPTEGLKYIPITIDFLTNTLFSVLRGLKGRDGRLKNKKDLRLIESPDEGVIVNYLLFPKQYEREFGSIRSGKLAYDSGRSLLNTLIMKDILIQQEGISNIPTVGSILAVGSKSSLVGNIVIEDWLKNIPMVLYGLGEAVVELKSYGFSYKEFTADQQSVLLNKISTTIAHVKNHIKYVREKIEAEIETLQFVNKNFLSETSYEEIYTLLNSEPILQQFISLIHKQIPFYKKNDIATFAGLHYHAQDLLYATISGNPDGLARFRNEFVNKQFITSLQEALLLNIVNDDKIYAPRINDCDHVKDLLKIMKVKDDSMRLQLLSKFITQYQAYKNNNWIYCIACNNPCLCEHETLLLKEFLYPREKDTIHKELLIHFSGGVFQGKYICNNCGQSISDLDFDTSLEYSDNGAPLIGRAELVDNDAIKEDELDEVLGVPVDSIESIKFDTESKTLYYQKLREIFDRVGIFPDSNGYLFMVNGIDATINRRPSREQYIAAEKSRQKQQKGQKSQDYDVYINRIILSAAIAYSIIEIQTHIPNYVPRYSTYGCSIDLRGYPLGTESDKRIITFMACIVNTIIVSKISDVSEDPWYLARFQDERSDMKRKETLIKYIESLLKEILVYADVQTLITKKKEYIYSLYGKTDQSEGFDESVPNSFTPVLYKEVNEIIIGDAANPYEKTRAYILETHKHAQETLKKEISPYIERTCCYNNLEKPLDFWSSKNLVNLGPKDISRGPINSHSAFTFELRKEEIFNFNVSKDDYYKLFLKVCYNGENIGLPHKYGYNKICSYCGFKVPDDSVTQGEQALREQNVEINDATFQKLLNAVHIVNSVIPEKKTSVTTGNELFQILYSITPSPFEDWKPILNETLIELIKLTKDANDAEFAVAYGKISSHAVQVLNELKDFIGENDKTIIEQMLNQPIRQIIESVQTSILVPLIRIIKGYNFDNLDIHKDYNLDGLIISDIKKFISLHTDYIKGIKTINDFAKSKINYAIEQLSSLLKTFQKYIRIPLIIGGHIGLQYIIQAGIVSILKDMVDTNVISPTNFLNNTSIDATSNAPKIILKLLIQKYKNERFRLTDEEIRIEIAKRNEKEKMEIISKFDRMTKEEKAVEKIKKKLGLGDWAVGGTKAIYLYNPEQYEKDRIQREQMGFVDFPSELQAIEAQDDNFYKQNNGCDHTQVAEDDY